MSAPGSKGPLSYIRIRTSLPCVFQYCVLVYTRTIRPTSRLRALLRTIRPTEALKPTLVALLLKNPSAKKYERISHYEAISKRLQALDSTALSLCMDNSLPIVVFDIFKTGNLASILSGDHVGTLITVEANS